MLSISYLPRFTGKPYMQELSIIRILLMELGQKQTDADTARMLVNTDQV